MVSRTAVRGLRQVTKAEGKMSVSDLKKEDLEGKVVSHDSYLLLMWFVLSSLDQLEVRSLEVKRKVIFGISYRRKGAQSIHGEAWNYTTHIVRQIDLCLDSVGCGTHAA